MFVTVLQVGKGSTGKYKQLNFSIFIVNSCFAQVSRSLKADLHETTRRICDCHSGVWQRLLRPLFLFISYRQNLKWDIFARINSLNNMRLINTASLIAWSCFVVKFSNGALAKPTTWDVVQVLVRSHGARKGKASVAVHWVKWKLGRKIMEQQTHTTSL